MQSGQNTVRGYWRWFNKHCFGNMMDMPKLTTYNYLYLAEHIPGKKKPRRTVLWGAYNTQTGEMVIRLRNNTNIAETVYHEMCHQFLFEVLDEWPRNHHGQLFQDVYNEGLSRIAPMGRWAIP